MPDLESEDLKAALQYAAQAGPSGAGCMRIWVDAQMSPAIATWISGNYAINAIAIRELGLRDAKDKEFSKPPGKRKLRL